jgi:tRNA (mo5U34)-methyltransferase
VTVDVNEIKEKVAQIEWFHTIDLGHGIITPGVDNTPCKLKKLGMPENLEGMTVLDIGAWNGFYSFEAEKREAKRVLATDSYCWNGEGWGTKDGFDLAKKVLNSQVEEREIDVLDLSPEEIGVFDLVLFSGVLYHMRHPLLALERVYNVTGRQLILETHVDMLGFKRPAIAFYPAQEAYNDPTNWCGPNIPAVNGMLKTVGFQKVDLIHPSSLWLRFSFIMRIARALKYKIKNNYPFFQSFRQGRMVFHAWR